MFPSAGFSQSFIPHSLRKNFGLPVYEQKDAIISYNFYRLLQRAKHVFMIYDSRSEGINSGEVSRFIYQLKYHYKVRVSEQNVHFDLSFNQPEPIKIVKNRAIQEKLSRYLDGNQTSIALSASSINTYVNCPLQFYLSSIEKLKETEKINELPGTDDFGTVFHSLMEYIFEPLKGKIVTEEVITQLVNNTVYLKNAVNKAIAVNYLKLRNPDNFIPEGNILLMSEVLLKYLVNVLQNDKKYAPFKYIESEKEFLLKVELGIGRVNIKGFIDRIDEKEGVIRILDYKTGEDKKEFKSLEDIFSHNIRKRNTYVLQTLLYGMYYNNIESNLIIQPGLYFIRNSIQEDFSTQLICKPDNKTTKIITDFNELKDDFSKHLTICIEEIFNPEIPFFQTSEVENCKYCSFKSICNRQ